MHLFIIIILKHTKNISGRVMKYSHVLNLILFFCSIPGLNAQDQPLYINSQNGINISYADVMGKSLSINQQTGDVELLSMLDFTVFPGFPVSQTGSTMEGSIFCNLDSDSDFEIVVCIGQSTYAFNMDGSAVTGWPKAITQAPSGAPAFGDIDGDGEGEIVVASYFGSSAGYVYAYEKDGSNVTGFPVNSGYVTRSATLADLNNDAAMEIIVSKRTYPTGQVVVYKGDGTVFPGWPKDMSSVPAASAAVGDITGDNIPEIVFEAYSALYVWDASGNPLPGFPYNLPAETVTSYSSPILVDLDGDNIREIVFGIHETGGALGGAVYILKNDGTLFPGWPKSTLYWIYAPPSVGDINGDGQLDIAVGDQVLSGTPTNRLYAWDKNGNVLPGFPVVNQNAINAQIILTDVDGDNLTELIYDDNTSSGTGEGYYHAINHDATPVTGWPLVTNGTTFFQTPCITDINNDGIMDMIGGGTAGFGTGATTNIYLWNSQLAYQVPEIQIPMFQYNTMHNGVFDNPTIVPVELISFSTSVLNDDVELIWTTSSELNNFGFEVQRRTEDSDFYTIGFVKGSGTTTGQNDYLFVDKDLSPLKYYYRLKQVDYNGTFDYSPILEVTISGVLEFSLGQNYPNPFNPSTMISYQLPVSGVVTLIVYDLLGREVATLVNEYKPAGRYEVKFDGYQLSSGVYLYKLTAGEYTAARKLTLMK